MITFRTLFENSHAIHEHLNEAESENGMIPSVEPFVEVVEAK